MVDVVGAVLVGGGLPVVHAMQVQQAISTSMQDMMVPLATDLCLFALQESRTTN